MTLGVVLWCEDRQVRAAGEAEQGGEQGGDCPLPAFLGGSSAQLLALQKHERWLGDHIGGTRPPASGHIVAYLHFPRFSETEYSVKSHN